MKKKTQKILNKFFKNYSLHLIVGISLIGIGFLGYRATKNYINTPRAPRIKSSLTDPVYAYSGGNQTFQFKIGDKKTNSPSVEFAVGEDSKISFTMLGLQNNSSKPTKSGNKITYKNAMSNTDVTYTSIPNGIKEEIIINAPTTTNTYVFSMNLYGTEAKYITNEYLSPVFYDQNENYLFHFEKPFAFDTSGARTDDVIIQIRKNPDNMQYEGRLVIDHDWLTSPDRIYPIIIDPTTVHDTTSEFSTGSFNRNTDTGSGSLPSIETYYQELAADKDTIGLWHFNESSDNGCSGGEDACDSSGNGYHGTATGTSIVSSRLGNARSFNGTSDGISMGDIDTVDYSDTISACTWVYLDSDSGSDNAIIHNAAASNDGIYLFRDDVSGISSRTDIYSIFIADSTDTDSVRLETPTNGSVFNTWTHVCFTYQRNNTQGLRLYINGDEVPDGPVDTTSIGATDATTNPFRVGIYNGTGGYFPGDIDEVIVSTRIFTPEEIKLMASRRPSSVYTSPVIDISEISTSWNSISWDEWGVSTGDGETVYDSTGLVAQWNFNETSGTTANNDAEGTSCGGTPSNCDGTLSGFDSTTSQDADPDSSWTANNRRWGTGALQFDGVDSYVGVTDNNSLDLTSDFTISMWIKRKRLATGEYLLTHYNSAASYQGFGFKFGTDDIVDMWTDGEAVWTNITNTPINDLKWHYISFVLDNNTVYAYIDGKLDKTTSSFSYASASSNSLYIGASPDASTVFGGSMDAVQIYSRALPENEIVSLYNATQVDFQTRIGADTSPDDGSWDAWSPATGETQIEDYDDTYMYGTSDSGLQAYLPMEETADNSCTGGEDACDVTGSYDAIDSGGSIIADGVFGNARGFDGSNDYLSISSPSLPTGDFTYEAWVSPNDDAGAYSSVLMASDGSGTNELTWIMINTNQLRLILKDAVNVTSTQTLTYGKWYHIAITRSGSTVTQYIDGAVDGTTTYGTALSFSTCPLLIGTDNDTSGCTDVLSDYFPGEIDEVRIYNSALSASTILSHALIGSTNPNSLHQDTDTVIKTESTASKKYTLGENSIEESTTYLLHMDETNGDNAGADILDSSPNANNCIFYGTNLSTAVVDGIKGKARNFNGTDDYMLCGSTNRPTNNFTYMAWFTTNSTHEIDAESTTSTAGTSGQNYLFFPQLVADPSAGSGLSVGTNGISVYEHSGGYMPPLAVYSGTLPQGWNHVAVVYTNKQPKIYLNGVLVETGSTSPKTTVYAPIYIGGATYGWHDGKADEIAVYDISMNAEQIAEIYRMGRNSYQTQTITSTDLSSKNQLAFDIASEVPGTYLETIISESSHVNTQADSSTVGLFHLDEETNNACGGGNYDACDSSGLGNHTSTLGNPIITQGKFGKARSFDGSDDSVEVSSVMGLGNTNMSIELWVNLDSTSESGAFVKIGENTATNNDGIGIGVGAATFDATSTGNNLIMLYEGVRWIDTNVDIGTGWHHLAMTIDGSSIPKAYIDGVSIGTYSGTSATAPTTGETSIGGYSSSTGVNRFVDATIDEVIISNTERSADEIRQNYERGLRTHPITIDFAASLDSGNLISSTSDYSFTVDATTKGLNQMGSNLYKGDKIIVKENDSGTEYIAQGTVTAVTQSTGAVTVSNWDTGSTVPSGGFTVNATVFKWQREYWNIEGEFLDSHKNAITNLTLKTIGNSMGTDFWIDDLNSVSSYLTDPSGSTITSSTGSQYIQYRAILSSWDEDVSATISAVTTDYEINVAPNTPSLDSPTDTATGQSWHAVLKTTATDTDSDYLRYKIELCEDVSMTTSCQTFDQTSSQTGWSGQDAQTSTAYASGTQATYTIQTALAANTTYYWRSYAIDPGGTNTWSSTQATPYSFSTDTTPDIPLQCTLEKANDNSNITVRWKDNSSDESGFRIERSLNGAAFSFLNTASTDSTSYQDSTIINGNKYEYRVASFLTYGTTSYYGDYCYASVSAPATSTFKIN